MSALAADAFLMPRGIIPRMAIMAAGHEARADPLKSPTDAAWWAKPYRVDLWNNLQTYAQELYKGFPTAHDVDFDEDVAAAKPSALREALRLVSSDMDRIREARWDHCAPWVIPERPKKPGVWPMPSATCNMPRSEIIDNAPGKENPLSGIPWWMWVIGVWVVTRKR